MGQQASNTLFGIFSPFPLLFVDGHGPRQFMYLDRNCSGIRDFVVSLCRYSSVRPMSSLLSNVPKVLGNLRPLLYWFTVARLQGPDGLLVEFLYLHQACLR